MGEISPASNSKAKIVISNALEEKCHLGKLFASAPGFNLLTPVSVRAQMVLGMARYPGSSIGNCRFTGRMWR